MSWNALIGGTNNRAKCKVRECFLFLKVRRWLGSRLIIIFTAFLRDYSGSLGKSKDKTVAVEGDNTAMRRREFII